MSGPLARILLRYAAAALVTYGLVDENTGQMLVGDADVVAVVQMVVGAAMMLLTEGYYWLAKRRDWET